MVTASHMGMTRSLSISSPHEILIVKIPPTQYQRPNGENPKPLPNLLFIYVKQRWFRRIIIPVDVSDSYMTQSAATSCHNYRIRYPSATQSLRPARHRNPPIKRRLVFALRFSHGNSAHMIGLINSDCIFSLIVVDCLFQASLYLFAKWIQCNKVRIAEYRFIIPKRKKIVCHEHVQWSIFAPITAAQPR